MENSRWFLTLCQVLAHNPDVFNMDRGELVTNTCSRRPYMTRFFRLFDHRPKVKEDLGDAADGSINANRVLAWFAGEGDPDPSISICHWRWWCRGQHARIGQGRKPVVGGRSTYGSQRGRARLASGEVATIFKVNGLALESGGRCASAGTRDPPVSLFQNRCASPINIRGRPIHWI